MLSVKEAIEIRDEVNNDLKGGGIQVLVNKCIGYNNWSEANKGTTEIEIREGAYYDIMYRILLVGTPELEDFNHSICPQLPEGIDYVL